MAESKEKDIPAQNPITGDTGPGTAITDLLPIPADTQPVSNPDKTEASNTLTEGPSLSHELATTDPEEKGLAQQAHEDEVLDLGWSQKKQEISQPLVGGMDNEELWLLIRRFDKQMYHVKSVPNPVPGGLDLNIADDEEFSPDKLRANLERLYMTVIIQSLAAVKHVARIRSWRERRRTVCFATAYFAAWLLDLIVPLLSLTMIVLIAYPPSRQIMFPPAPLALVDGKSGGVQKPKAGVLGSHDSATGAPEKHKGEAVEQEASNFVSGIASVALSSATGKHPGDTVDDEGPGDSVPDPSAIAASTAEARNVAAGTKQEAGSKHDKTKVPVETAMWTKMRPIMHALADVADTWERFGNALSPTAPFPRNAYRLRLALVVTPLLLVSSFVSSYMFTKGMTFAIGFGFFGDPVIARGLELLDRRFPNWQKLLELRNTVLKGVPTNAQLTITLLRIGEANKAPLPPPRTVTEATPEHPVAVTSEDLQATDGDAPLGATQSEINDAMRKDPATAQETDGKDIDDSKSSKHGGKGSRLLNFFKGTTKGAVKTAIGTDTIKAKAGSGKAKDRLGVIPRHQHIDGPVEFQARHKGHKGRVYISTKATIPVVAFSTDVKSDLEKIEAEHVHPAWSIAVADIVELKKIGGYGWKAKLVVGWSMGKEIADGLEIVTSQGDTVKVTACPLRDELFNRLVAMGGQKWEAW
ncbi:hypothetical protein J7T55_002418 [Diaporthe amygdali]|uniref:uncharacterized protein n=1 Tax=Phomopsis amygdali TaxID=1214568 RepID=UPI0022FE1CD0|nr:uncharacterized protein J7T55_002418 [Diaporthe amygdali]KAJ0121908.1 hypothetical protein J7T55_002418 [Diaporthe amygdali]